MHITLLDFYLSVLNKEQDKNNTFNAHIDTTL